MEKDKEFLNQLGKIYDSLQKIKILTKPIYEDCVEGAEQMYILELINEKAQFGLYECLSLIQQIEFGKPIQSQSDNPENATA